MQHIINRLLTAYFFCRSGCLISRHPKAHHEQIKPIICRFFAQIRFYCLSVFLFSGLSARNDLKAIKNRLFCQETRKIQGLRKIIIDLFAMYCI